MTSGKKSDFCLRLPKIELHAHLTGSITRPILQAIWDERAEHDIEFANQVPSPRVALQDDREGQDIGSFFGLFNTYLYKLISDLESLRKATRAVLEAFRDDGVVYLELRTTPRALPGHTSPETVREILAVLQAWNASEADGGVMRVNLILSIDRAKHDAVMAGEIVDLAMKTRDEGLPVVGIDICGDPQQPLNTEVMRLNILKAKEAGLGVTIHFAEVPLSSSHAELDDILSWGPDRLGHVIHVSADIQRRIIQAGIAVELCLTCNVLAGMLPRTPGAPTPSITNHHFASWWDQPSSRHLISLGTDDVGVFGSMPSEEHFLATQHFHLSEDDLVELSRNAIRFSFASEQEKRKVVSVLEQFRP